MHRFLLARSKVQLESLDFGRQYNLDTRSTESYDLIETRKTRLSAEYIFHHISTRNRKSNPWVQQRRGLSTTVTRMLTIPKGFLLESNIRVCKYPPHYLTNEIYVIVIKVQATEMN